MRILLEIPDSDIPKEQEIITVPIHFIDGTICEAGGFGFDIIPKGCGRLIDLDAFLNLFQEFDLEIATSALDGYPIMHYRFEEDNWKYMEEFTPVVVDAESENKK